MELQQILYSKRFEKQDNVGQVCSLDFWNSGHKQFVFVGTLREKPKTLTENKVHTTPEYAITKLMNQIIGNKELT